MFNAWLNADDTRRWMHFFSDRRMGCIASPAASIALAAVHYKMRFFSLAILCFSFCSPFLWLTWTQGLQEPWSFLVLLQNSLSQWGSLAHAKPFWCACIFPLISVGLTAFWGLYLASNLFCLKEYRQIVVVWPLLITEVLVSSIVLATFSVVQRYSISHHKKTKRPHPDILLWHEFYAYISWFYFYCR